MQLVLLVGAKLQHVIATLALENAGITGYFAGAKLKPRDELFWFNKPEFLLSLIHFILFQVVHDHKLQYLSLKGHSFCLMKLTCIFSLFDSLGRMHLNWLHFSGFGYFLFHKLICIHLDCWR